MNNVTKLYFVLCAFIFPVFNCYSQIAVNIESVNSKEQYKVQIRKSNKLLKMIERRKFNNVVELYYSEGNGSLSTTLFNQYIKWASEVLNDDSLIHHELILELVTHTYLETSASDIELSKTLYVIYNIEKKRYKYFNSIKVIFPLDNKLGLNYDYNFINAENEMKIDQDLKDLGPPKINR